MDGGIRGAQMGQFAVQLVMCLRDEVAQVTKSREKADTWMVSGTLL